MIRQHDTSHTRCTAAAKQHADALVACWPVVVEAAWLLRTESRGVQQLLNSGEIGLLDLPAVAAGPIAAFMIRYQSIGADLKDATLMYLAERENIGTIFTLDRRDFSVYRCSDGRALKIIPE